MQNNNLTSTFRVNQVRQLILFV